MCGLIDENMSYMAARRPHYRVFSDEGAISLIHSRVCLVFSCAQSTNSLPQTKHDGQKFAFNNCFGGLWRKLCENKQYNKDRWKSTHGRVWNWEVFGVDFMMISGVGVVLTNELRSDENHEIKAEEALSKDTRKTGKMQNEAHSLSFSTKEKRAKYIFSGKHEQ